MTKTPGQIAYEADCEIEPNYADGAPRKTWDQIGDLARLSWELTPRVRAHRRHPVASGEEVTR